MSDKQIVDRVKDLLYRSSVESATALQPVVPSAQLKMPAVPRPSSPSGSGETLVVPDKALQVLTLAQRTAEDHIAAANLQAHKMQADARAVAEQIRNDADAYAESVRTEADNLLISARATAEISRRDATAEADEIRLKAEMALVDANVESERIVAESRDKAEQLKVRAQQRFEDAVGGLSVKRASLQTQIEALEVFDTDYRQRLTSFLQSQLRALWSEQPQASDVVPVEAQRPGGPVRHSRQG